MCLGCRQASCPPFLHSRRGAGWEPRAPRYHFLAVELLNYSHGPWVTSSCLMASAQGAAGRGRCSWLLWCPQDTRPSWQWARGRLEQLLPTGTAPRPLQHTRPEAQSTEKRPACCPLRYRYPRERWGPGRQLAPCLGVCTGEPVEARGEAQPARAMQTLTSKPLMIWENPEKPNRRWGALRLQTGVAAHLRSPSTATGWWGEHATGNSQ